MTAPTEAFWHGFRHDPRSPAHAFLRASDADRERALDVLGEAYADGRLGVADLESRTAALSSAAILHDLVELLADLVPAAPPGPAAPAVVVRRPIVAGLRRRLAGELAVFAGSGTVCLLLWWLAGSGFFWPVWALVYTGIPPVLTMLTGLLVLAGRSRIAEGELEVRERPEVA